MTSCSGRSLRPPAMAKAGARSITHPRRAAAPLVHVIFALLRRACAVYHRRCRQENAMRLPIYQIDAFTDRLFAGNPAAVVPLETWLPDATLQAIAAENNLAETAFFLRESPDYALRWFTPAVEVDLCGHATLASAHVIFERLEPRLEKGGVSHAQSGDADGHAAGRGPGDGFS